MNTNELDGIPFPTLTERDTRQGRKKRRMLVLGLGILILAALLLAVGLRVIQGHGKSSLERHAGENPGPDHAGLQAAIGGTNGDDRATQNAEPAEGQIIHKGRIHEYNEDILTFLLLGIDSPDGIGEKKPPREGGQADVILLLVLDRAAGTLKLINIPRDTMAAVEVYDWEGSHVGTFEEQIALQYAYGDGREESARLTEAAVSRLFYGMPINGHFVLEMQGVAALNDAVGGVTLTVAEDMAGKSPRLIAGETVTLTGDEALTYVRHRDREGIGSNDRRNSRQLQYMLALFGQAREAAGADWSFPLRLYNLAKEHGMGSLTQSQAAYLAGQAPGLKFSADDVHSLAGTGTAPDVYEEFRVDEDELYELIVDIFYRDVGTAN